MLPWMRLYTRDWLDNKELRRCSPAARGVLFDLMCIAHEGVPYGYLCDKVGPLPIGFLASRCMVKNQQLAKLVAELVQHGRLAQDATGSYFVPRLLEDEQLRQQRAEEGRKGGNPKLKVADKAEVNLGDKGVDKHARAGADSDSNFSSGVDLSSKNKVVPISSAMFLQFWERYPRKFGEESACRDWCSEVTTENELEVLACLDRYLASEEVRRGVVMNAGSTMKDTGWIVKCARDKWKSDWPKAREPTVFKTKQQENADAWDRA